MKKRILKFLQDFGNAQIAGDSGVGTSMAVASGYQYNPETRRWEQSKENLKEAEGLRNNLSFISAFSPTHPTTALIEKAIIPGISYIGGKILRPIFKEITPKTSKMVVSNPENGTLLYTPDEIINSGDFAKGKEMAAKFFEHPVVKESYIHNQRLAKKLGITIPDKPNVAQVVRQPVSVTYGTTQDPNAIAEVARSHFGALDDKITMHWKAFPLNDLRQAAIHENLHRGWYSAPLKPQTVSKQYYEQVFKPEYAFWKWKTDKLLSPLGQVDNYLSDVLSGEAGPNLIDLGRDLGLKLGQKYPGYDTAIQMLKTYNGSRAFLIPRLNLTKSGMRHVWDAMTGKYFTPTTGIVIGTTINNDDE